MKLKVATAATQAEAAIQMTQVMQKLKATTVVLVAPQKEVATANAVATTTLVLQLQSLAVHPVMV
jgi:hypothetical protein